MTKIHSEEGMLKVRRTIFGAVEEDLEPINVRLFATDPARVRLSRGYTINLGNYESARVDVSIDVPCYQEEALGVIEQLSSFVEARAQQEAERIAATTGVSSNPAFASSPQNSPSTIEEML
jgi:hypothetical protein